jgi:large subunit ribosomal protein L29
MATRKKKEVAAPAKTSKAAELRNKDVAGLQAEIKDLQKAHFGLRMQKATQQLTNHSQLGNTRRDIARAKTIQAEAKRAAKKTTGAKK